MRRSAKQTLIIATIAGALVAAADAAEPDSANVHLRGSLTNSRVAFERGGRGHVAFIGGSITEMQGYRPMVCEILRRRFPGTRFTFTGKAVGIYVLAGPDAGMVEAAIDDAPARTIDLFHRFSSKLHYPRTVLFNADLTPGEHTLRLRVAGTKNPESTGHAVRIVQFVAN